MSSTEPTKMQVELTYKAEPTLTMTCITRVKSAEVCRELDDDSGVEFGEVDLRVCLEAILLASPELKKEEWSVYVLDQSASDRKFSGNGTITSVLSEDEPVPIVGKVKKKFRKESLDIELRLVKVPISPAKKQPTLSLEHLLPFALQHHSLHQSLPGPSSPILPPQQSSPALPPRRLFTPALQQNVPPASSFPPFTDQLWTDFDIPLQNQDFSSIFQDNPDLNIQWPCPDPQTFELPPQTMDNTPIPAQTPFTAPIPPPPQPGPPTPLEITEASESTKTRKRSSSLKEPKHKKTKKVRKEIALPSSPPIRAFKPFSVKDVDNFFQSESTSPAKLPDTYSFTGSTWEEFLVQSDSEQQKQQLDEHNPEPPVVAFTAVNSTADSSREFTARQILLNAEITPASSPEDSQSPTTESDSGSPVELTPFADTPAATQDASTSQNGNGGRQVLGDVTSQLSNKSSNDIPNDSANDTSNEASNVEVKEKRPRGRPKGWRKQRNLDAPFLQEMQSTYQPENRPRKPRKQSNESKEEDQWSVRIRTSINHAMLESITKGIPLFEIKFDNVGELPPMCVCCGDIQPTSWRYATIDDKQERFCNGISVNMPRLMLACGLYYKKYGVLKPVRDSPPRKAAPRRPKPRDQQKSSTTTPLPTVERETPVMCPSSPPQRTYEPMSEIDHPLLSEGICLPRMGYLRGNDPGESCDDGDDEGVGEKENLEPDDEMERFFSDVLG